VKSFASFHRNLARKPSAALGFLLLLASALLPAARLTESYGKLPLRFEPNRGQADSHVRFLSRGPGYTMRLLDQGAEIALSASGKRALVRMRLEGALPSAEATLSQSLPGVSNYFTGGDPSQWRTRIPGYARVSYRGVYPGIDLIYYGNQQQLEYDFRIAPHADPSRIRLAYDGVNSLRIDPSGDLILETPAGTLRQRKPFVYQLIDGRKMELAAGYRLQPGRKVTFALGPYDRSRPLVIDPILAYSTFLGGIALDRARGIAVDSTGAAYVVGETTSATFPTLSAAQATGGGSLDVFVTKLNPAGNALVYSTYLGGSADDAGLSIALDAANNAYITGYTQSSNFPTQSAANAALAGGTDGFIAKLGPNGDTLIFSTYLGGSGEDRGVSIAADSTGAYVAGNTSSANFPTASGLFGSYRGGTRDGFIVKVGTTGAIGFSSFFGGSADDSANGIAVDATGIYVAGYTSSTDLPLQGALYGASAGGVDAFAAKLNLAGNAITYSTYLGGSSDDRATSIAIDSTGAAYIAGWTYSSNFPLSSAYNSTFGGVFDGFLTKLNATGTALVYSTFLGGNGEDLITSVAVDSNTQPSVSGYTASSNFPTLGSSAAYYNGRNQGAFVTRFTSAGNALSYSTYLGGTSDDQSNGVAVDPNGAVYVAGSTQGPDFPTASAFQSSLQGSYDAFVAKLIEGTPLTFTVTTNPAGLNVTVDGITAPSPRYFGWTPGSTHSLSAPSPQGNGTTRNIFSSWSQGGAQTQNVTAPSANTTYTATYSVQNLLNLTASPAGAGTVSASPSSADGYYASSASVSVAAAPAAGYAFAGFNGDLTGTTSPQSLSMSAPRNVTATFSCLYNLTGSTIDVGGGTGTGSFGVNTGATCGYSATSNASWITVVSGGAGSGSSTVNYQVAANPTTSPRSGMITVAGGNVSLTYTINQAAMPPASLSFSTSPAGLQVLVDGTAYTTPATFQFAPGSTHQVGVPSPQGSGGVHYNFTAWSDGLSQTHQVTAPAAGVVALNASFSTSYLLTTVTNPAGTGTILASPASADGYYPAGATVQLTASPAVGATFTGWSGALTGTTNPQSLVMDQPKSVTASYSPTTCGSNYTLSPQAITAEAAGGTFTVNVASAPGCFWNATLSGAFIDPFLSITGPPSGTGNGSFQFTIQANATQFPRTASINVMGQLVQIVQHGVNVVQVFNDVDPSNIFFDYITLLNRYGTSNGCAPSVFCVNDVTTRGTMAELVIRSMLGEVFPYSQTPFFTDVPATHPQFKYIQKMKELGITDGCTTTTYCPADPVTRGQMAVFLIRGKLRVNSPQDFTYNATPYFLDAQSNNIFFPFIQKMRDLGITNGCTTTNYCVNDPNTLGQMAVFLIRSFNTP
jgi:hypothetical protein